MYQPVKIAPSILSADFMNLGQDIRMIEEGGAAFVHIDVMDGHFVPNLTMGVPLLKQLKPATNLLCDVHLMIDNPLDELPWFIDAGADLLNVHVEALDEADLARAIAQIHEAGLLAAAALKPKTPVSALSPVIAELDMALVMSVDPGFSGQSYIAGSDLKVAEVVQMARAAGNEELLIQVDGGIGLSTAPLVAAAGADVLVCGNAVFKADDPRAAIGAVKDAADEAREAALARGQWD